MIKSRTKPFYDVEIELVPIGSNKWRVVRRNIEGLGIARLIMHTRQLKTRERVRVVSCKVKRQVEARKARATKGATPCL